MGWGSFFKKVVKPVTTVAGGAIGTAFGNPGLGAAIGGTLGGMLGGGGIAANNLEQARYDPTAFTLAEAGRGKFGFDAAPQNEFRTRQMSLADQLALQARGEGPSVAMAAGNASRDALFRQGLSSVASNRGGGAATGQRSFLNALAAGNQQIGATQGIQALQEQEAARTTLANVLSGGRGQDIGIATTRAEGDLSARLYDLQAAQALEETKGRDKNERNRVRASLAELNARRDAADQAGLAAGLGAGLSLFQGTNSSTGRSASSANPTRGNIPF